MRCARSMPTRSTISSKPRASREQPAAFGSSQQGIERSVFFVAQVASVVSHNLDHLAIGKPSLLTDSGAPLWGEPVWEKGKEERAPGSYVLTAHSLRSQLTKSP